MSQFYLRCGTLWPGEPDGFNARGYPFVLCPARPGARPTNRRLYSAAEAARLMCLSEDELGAAHEPDGIPATEWAEQRS